MFRRPHLKGPPCIRVCSVLTQKAHIQDYVTGLEYVDTQQMTFNIKFNREIIKRENFPASSTFRRYKMYSKINLLWLFVTVAETVLALCLTIALSGVCGGDTSYDISLHPHPRNIYMPVGTPSAVPSKPALAEKSFAQADPDKILHRAGPTRTRHAPQSQTSGVTSKMLGGSAICPRHKPRVAARLASRSCRSSDVKESKVRQHRLGGNTARMHGPSSLAGSLGKESLPSAPLMMSLGSDSETKRIKSPFLSPSPCQLHPGSLNTLQLPQFAFVREIFSGPVPVAYSRRLRVTKLTECLPGPGQVEGWAKCRTSYPYMDIRTVMSSLCFYAEPRKLLPTGCLWLTQSSFAMNPYATTPVEGVGGGKPRTPANTRIKIAQTSTDEDHGSATMDSGFTKLPARLVGARILAVLPHSAFFNVGD
ncbi:hypothetical protein WN51_07580 [Melipona quadrifasciata]|uniref:Uncharacterized protein n=1 Tax=Melipona quadrifasciata TaxID=166423 RepID=A0A0M9A9P7_9HYME|nr:hypothetical protein WN51_07580 [Melipona quadrifasciata]